VLIICVNVCCPVIMGGPSCIIGALERGYSDCYWQDWTDLQCTSSSEVLVILTRLLDALQQHLLDVRRIFKECGTHVYKKILSYEAEWEDCLMKWEYAAEMEDYFSINLYPDLLPSAFYACVSELLLYFYVHENSDLLLVTIFATSVRELHRRVYFEVFQGVRAVQHSNDITRMQDMMISSSVHNFTHVQIPVGFEQLLGYGPKFSFGLPGEPKGVVRRVLKLVFGRLLWQYVYSDAPRSPDTVPFSVFAMHFQNPKVPAAVRDCFYDMVMEYQDYLQPEEYADMLSTRKVRPDVLSERDLFSSNDDSAGECGEDPLVGVEGKAEMVCVGEEVLKVRYELKKLLTFLQQHPDCVLIPSDKGCGYCFLPMHYFVGQYSKMITENPQYSQVTEEELNSAYSAHHKALCDRIAVDQTVLLAEGIPISTTWVWRLTKTRQIITPGVNLFPKVHKLVDVPGRDTTAEEKVLMLEPLKCRPIVTAHSAVGAEVEKYLSYRLQGLSKLLQGEMAALGFPGIIPRSTTCVLEAVVSAEVRRCGQSLVFMTYDFSSLYTHLQKRDLVLALEAHAARLGLTATACAFLLFLVDLLFGNNFVKVGGCYYRAEDGCPMGSYASRDIADFILLSSELQMASRVKCLGVFVWFRWIDDGCMFLHFCPSNVWERAARIISLMRHYYPAALTFEVEVSRTTLSILDYQLWNVPTPWRGLYYAVYFKATSRKTVAGPANCMPISMKRGIVTTELRRFLEHSCTLQEYNFCVSMLWSAYSRNGFSLQWFSACIIPFTDKSFLFGDGDGDRPLCELTNSAIPAMVTGDPFTYVLVCGGVFYCLTVSGHVYSTWAQYRGLQDLSIVRHLQLRYNQQLNPGATTKRSILCRDSRVHPVFGTNSICVSGTSLVAEVVQVLQAAGVDYLLSGPLYLENAFLGGYVLNQWAMLQDVYWQRHISLSLQANPSLTLIRLRLRDKGNRLSYSKGRCIRTVLPRTVQPDEAVCSDEVAASGAGAFDLVAEDEFGASAGDVVLRGGAAVDPLGIGVDGSPLGGEVLPRFGKDRGVTAIYVPMVHSMTSGLSNDLRIGVKRTLYKHRLRARFYYRSMRPLGQFLFTSRGFHDRLQKSMKRVGCKSVPCLKSTRTSTSGDESIIGP
jgi:hypothetical protein